MPKLSGLETLRLVKQFKAMLPCILMSAHWDDLLIEQARSAHAFLVLPKTVSLRQITGAVGQALERAYHWHDDTRGRPVVTYLAVLFLELSMSAILPDAPPTEWTMADVQARLAGIPLNRIRTYPSPGMATEADVLDAEVRSNRICELIDGTLVEKTVASYESWRWHRQWATFSIAFWRPRI